MNPMRRITRHHIGILAATMVILTSCASKPPGVNNRLLDYRVGEVRVAFTDKVDLGVFQRIDNEDDRDFVKRVQTSLEKTLRRSIESSLNGPKTADVSVTLTKIDVASGIGRVFERDSRMTGIVEVADAKSGAILAEGTISGSDRAISMGGNIGGLISLMSNVADAATTDRVDSLARDFSINLKYWIEN